MIKPKAISNICKSSSDLKKVLDIFGGVVILIIDSEPFCLIL